MPQAYYADSKAVFAQPGKPPIFDPAKRPHLGLAHLTSVPTTAEMRDFKVALGAHFAFQRQALSNPDTHEVLFRDDLGKPGLGIVLGIQHAPNSLVRDCVQILADEGVRFMGLAHCGSSQYGGGFHAEGGLTTKGRYLIEWMGEFGIILDLSNVNHQTATEALDFIQQKQLPTKVAATSVGCCAAFQHFQNVHDDVLERIGNAGGYVGVYVASCPPKHGVSIPNTDCLISHVFAAMNALRKKGFNKVGIGSDCPIDSVEHGDYLLPQIRKALSKDKFSPITAEAICGDNFRSFLKRSLPSRA